MAPFPFFGLTIGDFAFDIGALAGQVAVSALFRWAHQKTNHSIQMVKNAPEFEVDEMLERELDSRHGKYIEYACLTGVVQPQNRALTSYYRGVKEEGVIQRLTLVEHSRKRQQGFWSECKTTLRDAVNFEPFKLVSQDSRHEVYVNEPLAAESLMENLNTTFDKYTPSRTTVLERGIDRVFGDVPKGVQETEQMLSTGVYLLGIGKLVMEQGKVFIKPPDDESYQYFLTRLSKPEVLKVLQSKSQSLKYILYALNLIGALVVIHVIYKVYKKLKQRKEMKEFIDSLRSSGNEGDGDDSDSNCVICLSAPREVILLDCGHICICASCAFALPSPKKCPICRDVVVRTLPVFRP